MFQFLDRPLRHVFAPKRISGKRLEYYKTHLEALHASVSASSIAQAHICANNVSFFGEPLGQGIIRIGEFELTPEEFCQLFMVFNDSNSDLFENLRISRLGTPVGLYVRSKGPPFVGKLTRVGVYRRSCFDVFGKSIFLDHLMLKKGGGQPALLGTVALALSLFTAFRIGVSSVKMLAAGGHDPYFNQRPDWDYVGYKVFPKLGFDGEIFREERKDHEIPGCNTVRDLRNNHPGLWEQIGFQRFMWFDMRPYSQSWITLIGYLKGKGF